MCSQRIPVYATYAPTALKSKVHTQVYGRPNRVVIYQNNYSLVERLSEDEVLTQPQDFIDTDGANRISFPDCLIGSFVADDSQINFRSDGVFVDGVGFIGPDVEVECSISGAVQLREYADGEWANLGLSPSVGLREICEWNADDGNLTFAGFQSVSGLWAQYKVDGFSMKMTIFAGS
jgi:hypothetical protein